MIRYIDHDTADKLISRLCLVSYILKNPRYHDWSILGLGMMRLNSLNSRLHLWFDDLIYNPVPSAIHNHNWDFECLVLAGRIGCSVHAVTVIEDCKTHKIREVECGPDGGAVGEPKDCTTITQSQDWYNISDSYSLRKDQFHSTNFEDGTITQILKGYNHSNNTGKVYVIHSNSEEFVSAVPRKAKDIEVDHFCELASKKVEETIEVLKSRMVSVRL